MNTTSSSPAVGSMEYDNANNLPPGTSSMSSYSSGNMSPIPPAATPINVDTLGQGTSAPISLPPPTPNLPVTHNVTQPAGTTTDANGNATTPPPSIADQIQSAITEEGTEGNVENQLNQQAGVDTLQQNKTDAYNAYIKAQTDQRNTLATMTNGSGMDKFGFDSTAAAYKSQTDANIANLSVASNLASGQYTDAVDSVTKKLDAQFTPLKDQVTMLEALNTTENNDMTDSEKLEAQTKADQLKTDSANVQTAAHDIQTTLLKNGTYAQAAPKIDAIVQDYANGKVDAATAQSQMYAAASPYGVADLSGGIDTAQANLPQVTMTANQVPDPQAQAAFLAALPKDVATLVQGLANYTVNPNTFATRLLKDSPGMTRADAIALTEQYDPSYSEAQYPARQALQTNFASGSYSQNINSLNTGMAHLADIPSAFAKLGNVNFLSGLVNPVKNFFASKAEGSGAPAQASLNINAATGELASIFKSGGASDTEIKNLSALSTNSSPAQAKAVTQKAIDLIGSRLNALTDTYTSGMGRAPTASFLSPTNIATLSNLKNQGYDVNIKGVYFTDPTAYVKANSANAQALSTVRAQYPALSPAQATQYAQYLQENGQL